MCGIAGFIDFSNASEVSTLDKMVRALAHRGPDDKGSECYHEKNFVVGFAQARLSILDLSSLGHQPMHDHALSIVFNGEIYNFKEIRNELQGVGHTFSSESDTEVILKAYKQWGTDAIQKFIGMYAIVIYDRDIRKVFLIRDRSGVKPLYYYWDNQILLFSSELKAFHQHPSFKKIINKGALKQYFRYGYIPSPDTIFNNCHKVKSGSFVELDLPKKSIAETRYWDINNYYKKPKLSISYAEAKAHLHEIFKSAFVYRMVADVPVGVFLSGGFDSAAVTAIIQGQNVSRLKTFTIGFSEGSDEAPFAKTVAAHLGTDHHELYCTPKESHLIIPDLPHYFDEPFADSSAIPTILVSRFARQSVTVALSADGADEIFGGYDFYPVIDKNNRLLNQIPSAFKNFSKASANLLSNASILPEALRFRLSVAAEAINKNKMQQAAVLHDRLIGIPKNFESAIFSEDFTQGSPTEKYVIEGFQSEMEFVMSRDYQQYLQDDILVKVDRASMSCSLEGREPFLDQRIVEFAAQLPLEFKFSGELRKRILKDIVYEYIPREMMDRPKMGFVMPINRWLKNELAFLLDENLNRKSIAGSGIFNTDFVCDAVDRFKRGKLHNVQFIWKMLMFQMWYKKWMV